MKVIGSSSLIALLFAATFVAPAAASAGPAPTGMAPSYVSSEPSDGEMLEEAPDRVEVTFDEPLDPSSELKVTDECGRQVDDGNVEVQANTMSVGIELKPIGEYEAAYFVKGLGGFTGQESGSFDFMVHSGPSCDGTGGGNHGNHGGNGNGNGNGSGSGNHGGNHSGGGGNDDNHNGHSGSGSGGGTDHSSMDHDSSSGRDHSTMNHSGSDMGGAKHASGKHGSGKHGGGKHGAGKHGRGKHRDGAHGLLDLLDKNKDNQDRPLAAGGPGDLTAPDGQAIVMALALSLLMGVVGGWFLRVSGSP